MLPPTTIDSELALDAIHPVQFSVLWSGRTQTSPERRLLIAMIERAACDLCLFRRGRTAKARRMYRDAHDWVMSNSRTHIFAFLSICDVLGFSPQAVRAAMLEASEEAAIAA